MDKTATVLGTVVTGGAYGVTLGTASTLDLIWGGGEVLLNATNTFNAFKGTENNFSRSTTGLQLGMEFVDIPKDASWQLFFFDATMWAVDHTNK